MNRRQPGNFFYWLLLIVIVSSIAACRAPVATPARPTDSGVTPAEIPTLQIVAVQTSAPTATATPAAGKILLLAPPGSDAAMVTALQAQLSALAGGEGLVFETVDVFPENDVSLRLVVVTPPDPGLLNLAAANPQVQFLAVGVPGLEAAQNLSVLGSGGERPDQQGFLAGYLSAVISPDWRAAVVSLAGSSAGKAARNGFANGLTFYCGLCRPAYPPFVQYPIFIDLPDGFGQADLQAAVDTLTVNAAKTVYLAPGVDDAAFVETLAQAGFQLIGAAEPPAAAAERWVATIRADEMSAFQKTVERLLGGDEAIGSITPLALTSINPALLSVGRRRVVDEILNKLLEGAIDTGVDPQTGELPVE